MLCVLLFGGLKTYQGYAIELTVHEHGTFPYQKAVAVIGGSLLMWKWLEEGSQAIDAKFFRASVGAATTLTIYSLFESAPISFLSFQPTQNSRLDIWPPGGLKLAVVF